MAVPKKRTGHSAQGSRRANWKATKPTTTKCPNCGATVLAHTVCTACGTYKGQPVKLADKAAAKVVTEPVKTVKKETTAKKAAPKAEEVETAAKTTKTTKSTKSTAAKTTKSTKTTKSATAAKTAKTTTAKTKKTEK